MASGESGPKRTQRGGMPDHGKRELVLIVRMLGDSATAYSLSWAERPAKSQQWRNERVASGEFPKAISGRNDALSVMVWVARHLDELLHRPKE